MSQITRQASLSLTILITGATDGLGLEMARLYKAQGHKLLLLGRRDLGSLEPELFKQDNYIQADLASQDCCQQVEAALRELRVESLDMIIHNAGTGFVGELASQSDESIEELIRVNLISPILLTHLLLPRLSLGGRLVFIGSVVAALPTPKFAVYGASKAALQGFARSLRVELKGRAQVLVVHPGATRTGMHAKAGMTTDETRRFASPILVAKKICLAIEGGRRTATVGVFNRLLRFAGPLLNRPRIGRRLPTEPAHIFITGGADGIGRALVERYARARHRVTFVDVDRERGEELREKLARQGVDIRFLHLDLFVGQADDWQDIGPVDVVIHNAGINATGPFRTLTRAEQSRVLALNLTIPLQMTARFLQLGLLKEAGSVVLVSSLSHYVSYPGASAYAASKDGLAHFGRSLWSALGAEQRVLTVFPGPTRTAHARRHSPDNSKERSRMAPEELAERVFAAQQAGRRLLLPGLGAQVTALFGLLFPRLAERVMRRVLLEKFPSKQS